MKWFEYFDKVFLINLPRRADRLVESAMELKNHEIPFEVVPAIYNEKDGAAGLFETMLELFEDVEKLGLNNILVLEDDVRFTVDNLHIYMDECVDDLMALDWDLFYMGANVQDTLKPVRLGNILQCDRLLSTHAVAYSVAARTIILNEMRKGQRKVKHHSEPFDQLLERVVQKHGKCYISSKLLAVQRPSYSDILQNNIDWHRRIEDNFCQRIKEMKK